MDGNGSMIFRRSLGAIFVLLSLALAGSAPGQNQDPIQALKDTLTGGSSGQGGVLQNILGNGKGTKKQTDDKLNTPETIQPKTEESDQYENFKKDKTRDGRILRQFDEDPELRKDDSVLIEMTRSNSLSAKGSFAAFATESFSFTSSLACSMAYWEMSMPRTSTPGTAWVKS